MSGTFFCVLLGIIVGLLIIYYLFSKSPPPPKKEGERGGDSIPTTSTEEPSWYNRNKTVANWLLAGCSILVALTIGILASFYGYSYLNDNFVLTFWISCLIVWGVIILALIGCGLAIKFIIPSTNKNLAYAIIVFSFAGLFSEAAITQFRGDNFDIKTGEPKVWITPTTGKLWRDKPKDLIHDPIIGEKLRLATLEDFIKKSDLDSSLGSGVHSSAQSEIWWDSIIEIGEDVDGTKPDDGEKFFVGVVTSESRIRTLSTAPFLLKELKGGKWVSRINVRKGDMTLKDFKEGATVYVFGIVPTIIKYKVYF